MQRDTQGTTGYKSIIETQTRRVFDASISTKIFQHINRVRDSSHEGQARRWIWELIQNAKDAAHRDVPVRIRVVYTDETLEFSHTGRPFGIKNVLSIINQVSSKEPDDEETTGKFGTGFITTHLLSEKVQLDGIIQDKLLCEGAELLLPYKPFTVLLDRSGNSQEEILEAVNVAVNVISNLDSAPDVTPEEGGFHTTFTYFLTTPDSKKIAQIGMEDLRHSIIYALAFNTGVAEITLENRVEGSCCRFTSDGVPQGEGISLFHATEETDDSCRHHTLLLAREGESLLATPVEGEEFLPIHPLTPRLFVDFPLVGSEEFPFPVVCNNRRLLPDELRSGLPLSPNTNSVNSTSNKAILQRALTLYERLVGYGIEQHYRSFYHIAKMGDLPRRTDFDADWGKTHLYGGVLNYLYAQPVVRTAEGEWKDCGDVQFPHSPDREERSAIGRALALCNKTVPAEEDQEGWYQAFCGQAVEEQKIQKQLKSGERLLLDAEREKRTLGDSYLSYLQCVYDIAMKNPALRPRIEGGELAIFPDQTDEMTLHTASDISIDPGLDKAIKEAIRHLDQACYVGNLNPKKIYESLLHGEFQLGDLSTVHTISVDGLLTYIERKLEYNAHYLSQNLSQLYAAAVQMVSCYEDDYWLRLAGTIYPKETKKLPHQPTQFSTASGWRNAIILLINLTERKLAKCATVRNIQAAYLPDQSEQAVYGWLSEFYGQTFSFTTYLRNSDIFPDQRGELKKLKDLSLDGGIDETLKDILEGISRDTFFRFDLITDYRGTLLHRDITSLGGTNLSVQTLSNGQIANDITRHITALLNSKSLAEAGDEVQDACTQLLAWIQLHEEEAKERFPAFYPDESRMKLLTTRAAARMSGELSHLKGLMEEYGVTDLASALATLANQQGDDTPYTTFEDDDVFVDYSLLGELTSEERMEYTRRVGDYGEEQAFVYLCEKWQGEGYEIATQTGCEIVLIHSERRDTVTLSRPDSGGYHQAGWDISEALVTAEGQQPTHYYEVKSTVSEKRRTTLKLSCTQGECAMREGEHYSVISLFLYTALNGAREVVVIDNVALQLKNGGLKLMNDRLLLHINGKKDG